MVVHNENITSRGYVGGYDVSYWDPNNPEDVAAFRRGDLDRSIIVCALRPFEIVQRSYIDVTGHLHPKLSSGREGPELHFSTAAMYAKHWGIVQGEGDPLRWEAWAPDQPDCVPSLSNSVSTQVVFDKSTMKPLSKEIQGRGHCHGAYQYPGAAKTRAGYLSECVKPLDAFGRTIVTIGGG